MVTVEILNSHPVSVLKKEISKTNIKGYSKMKKNEIIDLMLKNKSRFSHIKKRESSTKKSSTKKIPIPKITITEAEPEKRKVFSRGGRFFKPKEPKSKLPPIPKSNIKIRLPKETKPKETNSKGRRVEHKKGFIPNTKEQKKELEEVEKIVKDNKNNFIIPKDYNRVSSLIDKFKLYSNNKLNKTKFQYKFKQYHREEEKTTYLKGTKEINEVVIDYEIYNKDLSLYKTITANLKDKTGEFYKIKEPYLHTTIFKLKLENEKEEPKKEDFKFNEKNLKIESQTWGTVKVMSIMFFNENENVYIEFTLRKGMTNSLLFLEHLSSQFEKKNPRAQKGYTRAMLCHIINKLLKEKLVKEDSKFGLIAGDIGGITGKMERTHNIKNLVKMYKSMGFKTKPGAVRGQQQMETTVENVLKWCNTKYKL